MCALFWLVFDSSFVNITDYTLSKLRYLIFFKSKLLSFCSHSGGQGSSSYRISYTDLSLFNNLWPWHCLFADQHSTLKWLAYHDCHIILQYAEHCLWGCHVLQYLQLLITLFLFCLALSCFCLSCLIKSNYLSSLIWPCNSFWTLWASTLWVYINMWWLFASLISLSTVSSPNISPITTSSSNPWINCCVSLHAYWWYSQSDAFVCILPSIPGYIG